MLAAYRAAYSAKDSKTTNICDAISQAAGYTPKEAALTDWLNMIIVKNWALSSAECKVHRNMCKHKSTFSVKRISMIMLILGEVVESKITQMLATAKAVGLYDGFTRNSTHYIALYVSFIEGEGLQDENTTHRIILLGVSPRLGMKKDAATDGNNDDSTSTDAADDDDVECGHYSYKFDAEHHLHHFNTILKAYGQNVNDLFVAFLSDNASVNRKTARLAGVPHLPCQNHTHALDVGEW